MDRKTKIKNGIITTIEGIGIMLFFCIDWVSLLGF